MAFSTRTLSLALISLFSWAGLADEPETPAKKRSQTEGRLGRVEAFLQPGCPIARYHTATLRRCYERFGPRGISFEGYIPNPLATAASAARYVEAYQLPFPVHPDPTMEKAKAKQVATVPEVLVYDKDERLVYRGRIDDTFAGIGKRKPVTRSHDLADTLEALADGQTLNPRSTQAVGCTLTFPNPITPASPEPTSAPSP